MEHPNLAVERSKTTFPEAAMKDYVNGSPKETVLRDGIMVGIHSIPAAFVKKSNAHTSRNTSRNATPSSIALPRCLTPIYRFF